MNKQLDARDSLCWNCKFGLCVQETEQESIFHPGIMPGPQDDIFSGMEQNEENEPEEIVEHKLQHERVKTICFWRPEGLTNSPPILVSLVGKCSRFEKK